MEPEPRASCLCSNRNFKGGRYGSRNFALASGRADSSHHHLVPHLPSLIRAGEPSFSPAPRTRTSHIRHALGPSFATGTAKLHHLFWSPRNGTWLRWFHRWPRRSRRWRLRFWFRRLSGFTTCLYIVTSMGSGKLSFAWADLHDGPDFGTLRHRIARYSSFQAARRRCPGHVPRSGVARRAKPRASAPP